ncbi:MAG: hypothetical protein MI723_03530 [Caulobacterales bacterium]|nr:hypothetical protein [Caulobacterales bacterium]
MTRRIKPDDESSELSATHAVEGVSESGRLSSRGGRAFGALVTAILRILPGGAKAASSSIMDFDEFRPRLLAEADRILSSGFADESAYLDAVSALVARLDVQTIPIRPGKALDTLPGNLFSLPISTDNFGAYVVVMEPNAVLPLHDHRDYNGVILGISGECDAQYFDIDDMPDGYATGAPVILKRKGRLHIKRGDVGSLSRTTNNVHEIRAGAEGCVMLDIFAFAQDDAHSYFVNPTKGSVFGDEAVIEAEWGEPI